MRLARRLTEPTGRPVRATGPTLTGARGYLRELQPDDENPPHPDYRVRARRNAGWRGDRATGRDVDWFAEVRRAQPTGVALEAARATALAATRSRFDPFFRRAREQAVGLWWEMAERGLTAERAAWWARRAADTGRYAEAAAWLALAETLAGGGRRP